mgnify:CR=1 FL=1
MIEKLKELGWKKTGGFLVMAFVAFAFIFGGFGGGFSTNNQNNIAKINKTNVTTQDFIDYVNQSGISQETIRDNLENNIIFRPIINKQNETTTEGNTTINEDFSGKVIVIFNIKTIVPSASSNNSGYEDFINLTKEVLIGKS